MQLTDGYVGTSVISFIWEVYIYFYVFPCSITANVNYGQLEKTSPADSSCPEMYRSQKYFLKYYGSFLLEDVANMQITNPKPFSSAKYPNNKHAVNSCTHILTWGESKWYGPEKNNWLLKEKSCLVSFANPIRSAQKAEGKKKIHIIFKTQEPNYLVLFLFSFLMNYLANIARLLLIKNLV